MRIAISALAVGLSLAACDSRPSKYELEDFVKANLRDPASAKFSNTQFYRNPAGLFVLCGNVNARNGFGGMTGPTQFVAWKNESRTDGDILFAPSPSASQLERSIFRGQQAGYCTNAPTP